MTRLPRLKSKELIRILEKLGFRSFAAEAVISSSHQDGRVTTVPVHTGEVIGLVSQILILRDPELSVDDLLRYL